MAQCLFQGLRRRLANLQRLGGAFIGLVSEAFELKSYKRSLDLPIVEVAGAGQSINRRRGLS